MTNVSNYKINFLSRYNKKDQKSEPVTIIDLNTAYLIFQNIFENIDLLSNYEDIMKNGIN